MIVPFLRSQLEPLKTLTFEETPEAAELYEVSRTTPERAAEVLDNWLAKELSLPPREAEKIPWFDLLVTRWRGEGRLAFETAEAQLTYEDLDRSTKMRAAQWKAQGVTRGASICVCRRIGVEYVLDLLTGFRIGACMAWVPPYGEPYERSLLQAFAPDFVTAEASAQQRLGPHVAAQVLQCDASQGGPAVRGAAHYERQEPCLAVLSPTAAAAKFDEKPSAQPTLLDCESLQRAVARDAALVWLLRPGDAVAAPGFDGAREQPSLVLSCLLSGAQFVHISVNEVLAGSKRLRRPWRALGVREASRDAWLDAPETRPEADIWFRDLEEGGQAGPWLKFQESQREALCCAVHMDPALGGVVLTTRRGLEILDSTVRVALGVDFEVIPLEGASPEAETGLLKLAALGNTAPYVLVSKTRGERYRYLGPSGPRRAGIVYPRDVVVEAVMSLPCVIGASIVTPVRGGERSGFSFGLLVFVHAPSGWNEELGRQVLRTVEAFLSEVLAAEIRPDFVECYPLGPARSEDGGLDDSWVAVQWLRGAFRKKKRLPIFRHLAVLAAPEA